MSKKQYILFGNNNISIITNKNNANFTFNIMNSQLTIHNIKEQICCDYMFTKLYLYNKEIQMLVTETVNNWHSDYNANFITIIYLKLFCLICNDMIDIAPNISSKNNIFYNCGYDDLRSEYYELIRHMHIDSFNNGIIKGQTKYEDFKISLSEHNIQEFSNLYDAYNEILKYIKNNLI